MKCIYCGEEFEQNSRGRKKAYCNKKDCIKKARNDANKKWYANKMKTLGEAKIKIKSENRIVYSSTDRIINKLNNEDFSDVLEFARKLGAIRFEITEEIKKLQQKQSPFDIQDEIFLHKLEDFAKQDELHEDEVITAVREHINKRQNRRMIKDKEIMYKHLIQGLISNPNAYVVDFIKNRDNRTYNPNKEAKLGIKEKTNQNKS